MNSTDAGEGDRDATHEPPSSGQSGDLGDSIDSDDSNDSDDEDDSSESGLEDYDNRWRESLSDYRHYDPLSYKKGERAEEGDRSNHMVNVKHNSPVLHESTESRGGHQFTAGLDNHRRPLNDKVESGVYVERFDGLNAPRYGTDDESDDEGEQEIIEVREKCEGDDDDSGDDDDRMYEDDDAGIYDDDMYDNDDDSGIET